MKAIRYIASILLLAAGVGHLVMFIRSPGDPVSAVILAFGILYAVIGMLLFLDMKYAALAGIILPLAGIIVGLIIFDPSQRTPLLGVLGIAEVAIISLCSILEWKRRRKQ